MAKLSELKRPPRHVMVCGHKIPVKYHRDPLIDDEGHELLGAFRSDVLEIHISKHENWLSTLLHEITHAALFVTGANQGMSIKTEERIVVALEHAFLPFIK